MSDRQPSKARAAEPVDPDGNPRDRRWTYAGVILLEVIVVSALWLFSTYFSR